HLDRRTFSAITVIDIESELSFNQVRDPLERALIGYDNFGDAAAYEMVHYLDLANVHHARIGFEPLNRPIEVNSISHQRNAYALSSTMRRSRGILSFATHTCRKLEEDKIGKKFAMGSATRTSSLGGHRADGIG
ncbi:hypothetical protein HAX54_037159, partial [Datura stramonium]|nr:hypothetical protein [Datura stramonium]